MTARGDSVNSISRKEDLTSSLAKDGDSDLAQITAGTAMVPSPWPDIMGSSRSKAPA